MAELNKSTGASPPYEQNAPYSTTTPAQPMMHQDTGYSHPSSPPPQAYPQHDPYAQQPNVISPHPQQYQNPPMASPPIEKGSYYGQGPQPVQQGIPMQGFQQQQQQSQYHVAMPLQNLLEGAAPVDCPACHTRTLTRTEYVSGNTTMGWAAAICCVFGLGCIPFMMRSLKDVEHHCGKCGVLLATWHNSGRTVVHIHPQG